MARAGLLASAAALAKLHQAMFGVCRVAAERNFNLTHLTIAYIYICIHMAYALYTDVYIYIYVIVDDVCLSLLCYIVLSKSFRLKGFGLGMFPLILRVLSRDY